MVDKAQDDVLLEGFLAAARACPPEPSAALVARIEAEALRLQPALAGKTGTRRSAVVLGVLSGRLAGLRAMLGGWSAVGGMATAAAAGVWIGFAGAERLGDVTGGLIGYAETASAVDLMPQDAGLSLAMGN